MRQPRLTIAQVMVFVALVALYLPATLSSINGDYVKLRYLDACVVVVGFGVLVSNLRLSGWMWLVVLGYAGLTLSGLGAWLAGCFLPRPPSPGRLATIYHVQQWGMRLLFVAGLAMTFRDIRAGLAAGAGTRPLAAP